MFEYCVAFILPLKRRVWRRDSLSDSLRQTLRELCVSAVKLFRKLLKTIFAVPEALIEIRPAGYF